MVWVVCVVRVCVDRGVCCVRDCVDACVVCQCVLRLRAWEWIGDCVRVAMTCGASDMWGSQFCRVYGLAGAGLASPYPPPLDPAGLDFPH